MREERPVTMTQHYAPKAHHPRTVTIEAVPALELSADGQTEVGLESAVCERLQILVERALAANDLRDQRVRYTADDVTPSNSGSSVAASTGPTRSRSRG
jgi:hypothetical protein